MRMLIRGTLAAVALSAAVVLAAAPAANAAITVTLSPTAGLIGTPVDVLAANCAQDATGEVEGTSVAFDLVQDNNNATGTFTVTDEMEPGVHTVAVTCGGDTASAKFTVTSGAAPQTGGGATASDAATVALWSGAALVAAAAAGLWLLKRRGAAA